jgi:hypothetical protein
LLAINVYGNPQDSLTSGIYFLEENQISAAATEFRKIPFGNQHWTSKVLALMRALLLKHDYQEVWRLAQILKRTKLLSMEAIQLEKTALLLNQTCPLNLPETIESFDALISADYYRQLKRTPIRPEKLSGESMDAWHRGTIISFLTGNLPFYLKDIPNSYLSKNLNCYLFSLKIVGSENLDNLEFASLITFLTSRSMSTYQLVATPQHEALVLARALILAQNLKSSSGDLTVFLKKLVPEVLIELPDPERRVLWNALITLKQIPPLQQKDLLVQFLLKATVAAEVDWLEFLDLSSLSNDERIELLSKLVVIEGYEDNEYLLLNLAKGYWQKADSNSTRQTLQILRRLLVNRITPLSGPGKQASLDLAASIFASLPYNSTALGAFHASVPNSLWRDYHRKLLRELAIRGETARLVRTITMMPGVNKMSVLETRALIAIANRDVRDFRKLFAESRKSIRLPKPLQLIVEDLAALQLTLSKHERREFKEMNDEAIAMLKKLIESHKIRDTEHWQQLIHLLSSADTDDWATGNASARTGVVNVGTISFQSYQNLTNPFKFRVPDSLPIRELIFFPERAGGQIWILR